MFISGAGATDVLCGDGAHVGQRGQNVCLLSSMPIAMASATAKMNIKWAGKTNRPPPRYILPMSKSPAENLLGEEGQGFTFAMKGLDGGRINIATVRWVRLKLPLTVPCSMYRSVASLAKPLTNSKTCSLNLLICSPIWCRLGRWCDWRRIIWIPNRPMPRRIVRWQNALPRIWVWYRQPSAAATRWLWLSTRISARRHVRDLRVHPSRRH